jgi:hypothetical protein
VRDDVRSLAWAEALRDIVGGLHGGGGDASCGLALFASFVGCGASRAEDARLRNNDERGCGARRFTGLVGCLIGGLWWSCSEMWCSGAYGQVEGLLESDESSASQH